MAVVAGIDSSTQSCKIVIRDTDTGALVASASAPHPEGSEIDPRHWWDACRTVIDAVGGLSGVAALSVGAQQHGMVCLDEAGQVIRPALLWHDTRSATAASDLVAEHGPAQWAADTGSVPVASFTVTKLRWLAEHEPHHAARVAAICLPHDWLTWRLSGSSDINDLTTDRSDASGTGWFSPTTNSYLPSLVRLALGRDDVVLPRVLGPTEVAGHGDPLQGWGHVVLGPGCGDNAGAALGLGLGPGESLVSLGTSGVVASVSDTPTRDESGLVTSFADATGRHLPLACTLNGSRVLDATARLLGIGHDELSRLALAAAPGADGMALTPYLEGERTPNLPDATGTLTGLTLAAMTRENLARAAVEGLLQLMRGAMDAVRDQDVVIDRVQLIGGGARSLAIQTLAAEILAAEVTVPEPGEYVAEGAARQAAGVLAHQVGGESRP